MLFEDAPGWEDAPGSASPWVVRNRAVRIRRDLLDQLPEDASSMLVFNLFDNVHVTGIFTQVERRGADRYTWWGTLAEVPLGRFILVVEGPAVVADIQAPDVGTFHLRTPADGVHVVREIDPNRFSPPDRDAAGGTDDGLIPFAVHEVNTALPKNRAADPSQVPSMNEPIDALPQPQEPDDQGAATLSVPICNCEASGNYDCDYGFYCTSRYNCIRDICGFGYCDRLCVTDCFGQTDSTCCRQVCSIDIRCCTEGWNCDCERLEHDLCGHANECEGCLNPVYVNKNYSGESDGSEARPFKTVGQGIDRVCSSGTLLIVAGDYHEAPLTIAKPTTLQATGGAVTIGP